MISRYPDIQKLQQAAGIGINLTAKRTKLALPCSRCEAEGASAFQTLTEVCEVCDVRDVCDVCGVCDVRDAHKALVAWAAQRSLGVKNVACL